MKTIGITFIVISILLVVGPILCCMAACQISDYYGVPCSERGPEIIVCCGYDIGGVVYTMAMMPWFLLLTVPLFPFVFLVGILFLGAGFVKGSK